MGKVGKIVLIASFAIGFLCMMVGIHGIITMHVEPDGVRHGDVTVYTYDNGKIHFRERDDGLFESLITDTSGTLLLSMQGRESRFTFDCAEIVIARMNR